MLTYIEGLAPPPSTNALSQSSEELKYLRGIWLVGLYGAVEKSINTIFSEVLDHIILSETPYRSLKPSLKAIFGYPQIQSIKDCGYDTLVARAVNFFSQADSAEHVGLTINPLTSYLQNVDGKSVLFLCKVLSIPDYVIDPGHLGRLNNLKDRRNAVAHGRESAAEAGARFSTGLAELHALALEETSRFHFACDDYCATSGFLR